MGNSESHKNSDKKPTVIIVGGGYGGTQCAKLLDKTNQFFVILIDRKSYFLHNIGTLRATVEQGIPQQIIVPYDRLLSNGCVIQAEVVSISDNGIYVHGRKDPIPFNYLVIATGSSYAFPGKVADANAEKAIHLYDDLREKIKKSQTILIIGGGPVGVELAGELATDYPEKEITIIHSHARLLRENVYQEKVYTLLEEQLRSLNVKVIVNERIKFSNDKDFQNYNYIDKKTTFTTESNKVTLTADLTFVCTGARVNNKSILNGSLKSKINPQTGRIMVNNYLQVEGYENIFAIGDICNKEEKFAYIAAEQAHYVAKLIPRIENKQSYPKEYPSSRNIAIVLSVGRNQGVGQLPFLNGAVIGGFLTKHIKSKDMFTSRFRSLLNYKSDNQPENKDAYENRAESIQTLLAFTEEDARKLIAGLPAQQLESGQDFT